MISQELAAEDAALDTEVVDLADERTSAFLKQGRIQAKIVRTVKSIGSLTKQPELGIRKKPKFICDCELLLY